MFRGSSFTFAVLAIFSFVSTVSGDVITFESLPVNSGGYYNGDTSATSPLRDNYSSIGTGSNFGATEHLQQWTIGGVSFNNNYTPDFDSWTGWSWSNVANGTTAGFGNQYAAFPGGGSNGLGGTTVGGKYAVAFGDGAYINLPTGAILNSVDLSNTAYAGLSMNDGDAFAKKFGGLTGNDADFFRVTLTGFSSFGGLGAVVNSLTVDLADYTFADNNLDYVLNTWKQVDLSSLSGSKSIGLTFSSSDVSFGFINTPTYLALDNLNFTATSVPEPGSMLTLSVVILGLGWRKRRQLGFAGQP